MDVEHYLLSNSQCMITSEVIEWYHACGILDREGKIIYVSEHHKDITGFKPHEVLGTKLCDRINQEDLPHIHEQHIHMVKTGKPVECKFEIRYADGLYYTVRSFVIPQYNREGDFSGSIMLAHKRNANTEKFVDIATYRKTHELSPLPFQIAI